MNVILEKRKRPPLAELVIRSSEGDEAFFTWDAAFEQAFERSTVTGLRHQVRATRPGGYWVVQAIR